LIAMAAKESLKTGKPVQVVSV